MLAAILKDFDNLVLEDVPKPKPGPGEVLVRIKSCGFCATDYKAIKGIQLDGGLMHFLEARMDSSFSTTPQAIEKAIRLMDRGLVDVEKVISHRFPLSEIHKAVEAMGSKERNKVIINP